MSPVLSPSPVRQRSRLPSPSSSAESPRSRSPVFSPSPVRQRSRLPSPSSSAESPRRMSPTATARVPVAVPPLPVTQRSHQPALQGRRTKAAYNISCTLYGREFKNQRQKFDKKQIVIQGNNTKSIVSDLWQKVSSYVEREVLISTAGKAVVKATWAVLDDTSRFVEITLSGGNCRLTYKPIHIVQKPSLLDKIPLR
ncbi:CLK4-associating serine/arginine rich protein-like [Culex quinquefasciatus]|uniref:CLK4-associating serine/arginine rich protein-like n=1 Tax=Culex quinquefasciatus TaxID=7176 RepID=UPI0018E30657|nr:CLK4-associating serine/arginine rich protein-like [Culex quinquefasciatus]